MGHTIKFEEIYCMNKNSKRSKCCGRRRASQPTLQVEMWDPYCCKLEEEANKKETIWIGKTIDNELAIE
jgi:hypothetical protein